MFTGAANSGLRRVTTQSTACAAFVLFSLVMLGEMSRGRGYDLIPIATAGRLVSTGQMDHLYARDRQFYNVVNDADFSQAAAALGYRSEPTPFVYPPLVAFVAQPLGRIGFSVTQSAWAAASILFLLAGLQLTLVVFVPDSCSPLIFGAVTVLLCLFEPVRYAFWLGQTTPLIFALVMGAIYLQRTGRPAVSGVLLAIAAFVKLTPAVLALVWLWRGPRRAAYWCGACFAGLWGASVALAGWEINLAYVRRISEIGNGVVIAYNNHSVLSFVSRLAQPRGEWVDWRIHQPQPILSLITGVILIALGATAMAAMRRVPRSAEHIWRPSAEAFAVLAMLLVPGVAWTHYFVFLLPVIGVMLSVRTAGAFVPVAAGMAFALCCRPLLMPQSTPEHWAATLAVGAPTIAAVALWLTLATAIASREQRVTGDVAVI